LCLPLRLHAFTFPIPFLEPYTSQQDGERGTVKLASRVLSFLCRSPACVVLRLISVRVSGNAVDAINDLYAALAAGLAGPRRLDGVSRRPLQGVMERGAVRWPRLNC
jgi:hypothetical protein